VGASSTGGGASGRGQESTDIAKAKIKAATHMAAGLNSSPNKGMQGKARVAMVGLVITIAQRKGGAGKTTLATQLAAVWARCGARVAALDIDPQGKFSTWILRILAAKGVSLLLCAPTGRAAKRMTQATGLEDDHPLSRFCRTSRTLPCPASGGGQLVAVTRAAWRRTAPG
jgi:hypothetical protein